MFEVAILIALIIGFAVGWAIRALNPALRQKRIESRIKRSWHRAHLQIEADRKLFTRTPVRAEDFMLLAEAAKRDGLA